MPIFFTEAEAILYVHVPKTGGSSVEALFLSSGYEVYFLHTQFAAITRTMACSPQHYHADLLRNCFKLDQFDLIFMTVRHPVDRALSEYRMRNPEGDAPDAWIMEVLERQVADPFHLDNHLRPQVEFHVPGARVFRQEDRFDADWVRHMNGLLQRPLVHRPVARLQSKTTGLHFSLETTRRIEDFYSADMSFFGY
ncbi:MAG: sulfotransferase family 2 domain-containing protein [Sulfitobacter sp.]|nr:sulfotransferase family 2 domain-containing protein [Sulfitobacter sp.]